MGHKKTHIKSSHWKRVKKVCIVFLQKENGDFVDEI